MRTILTSVILLLLPAVLMGQSAKDLPVKISGVVFSEEGLMPLPNVHFRIESRKIAGLTNMQGRFEVNTTYSDTIRFTYIGYKDAFFLVADTLLPGDYVAAIILSRDTILIQEVVILPRRKSLRQEFINAEPAPDPALANAQRNLQVSAYQGVTGKGVEFDADMSYQLQTRRMEMRAMNLGMISPDQMIALNFIAVIPYMIYKLNQGDEAIKAPDIFITDAEIDALLENYLKKVYSKTCLPAAKASKTDTLPDNR